MTDAANLPQRVEFTNIDGINYQARSTILELTEPNIARYGGPCPFCGDPSFSLILTNGSYWCGCGANGRAYAGRER